MSDFEEDFFEYSEYGEEVSEDDFGEECGEDNEETGDYHNYYEDEEDEELENSELLKLALSKLNKSKPSETEFNAVWHLIFSCRVDLSQSKDVGLATIILNAIQKLIDKGFTAGYYPISLVTLTHYHVAITKKANKTKAKLFTKLLKSVINQVKVMEFASKFLSLHDLKTLSTSSTNIPSPQILSKEPETFKKTNNERVGKPTRSGRPSVKLNGPRGVDEVSKEIEEKEILIKSIQPSSLVIILNKKVKCRPFSELKILLPVRWIDAVFNRDGEDDDEHSSNEPEMEKSKLDQVEADIGGLVL